MLVPYNHLVGYLHRWTVCKIGKLHVRIHHILTGDGTPFLHNHPFGYVSVLFKGGYTEQVLVDGEVKTYHHSAPTIIFRKAATFHRIKSVDGVCKTLFFALGKGGWTLIRHKSIVPPPTYVRPLQDGLYHRMVNGEHVYSKFENGMWFVGDDDIQLAKHNTVLSVHQTIGWWR